MKKPELIKLLTMIENFYPGRFKCDDFTAETWWEVLKDYDFDFCMKNLQKHVQVGEWPPAIANLLKGHRDMSRTYSDPLMDNIERKMTPEETIADIERRTGRKVIL
jgi:hypothetical protein